MSSDSFYKQITDLPSAHQHASMWLLCATLHLNLPEISLDVFWYFQPGWNRPTAHEKIYQSSVLISNIILLATDPLPRHLQTSIFTVLQNYLFLCKITWVYCLVLWWIHWIDYFGLQVERIHRLFLVLPLPWHQTLYHPEFYCHPWKW